MDEYNAYLAKNCKRSKKAGRLKKMKKRHGDFRKMAKELKRLSDGVKRIKGIKLTVEVK